MHSDFGSSLEQGLIELPHPEPLPGRRDPFPFVFVGDEAFPLKTYLMRPYSKPKKRRREQEASAVEIAAVSQTNDEDIINNDEDIQECNTNESFSGLTEITLSLPQRVFNYRLSRARRVIENAFGIIVSKWAILKGTICYKLDTAESIVIAIICLHNFLMDSEIDIPPMQRLYQNMGLVDNDGPNGEPLENGMWRIQVSDESVLQRTGRLAGNNPARTAIALRNQLRDYFLTEDGEVVWQYDCALRNVPIIRGPQ